MDKDRLAALYRSYIYCLNRQDWANLGQFVGEDARHNGKRLGLDGYQRMLEQDFAAIPDLRFNIALLLADPPFMQAG